MSQILQIVGVGSERIDIIVEPLRCRQVLFSVRLARHGNIEVLLVGNRLLFWLLIVQGYHLSQPVLMVEPYSLLFYSSNF